MSAICSRHCRHYSSKLRYVSRKKNTLNAMWKIDNDTKNIPQHAQTNSRD